MDGGIFQLFEQGAGKAHVETGGTFIAFEHSRGSIIAPQDLFCFPALARVEEGEEIAQGLMHVKPQRMIDVRHEELLLLVERNCKWKIGSGTDLDYE